ncbi:MAG: UDP-3-O-(3-hydroxymyristoyl)glucosamine N-acyltransferase [Acidobacteriota bacterium]|jgi:UDP-3-O-[3-hydroxymyristoyl] glucosamine N-acyltransferase|nr:UDP-3-O-(3-hydroxymyristoyl)glucosamine N-acyltransferase [Acidobacteriota bacterium]
MSLTIEKIVEFVSGKLVGEGAIKIYRVSSLENAQTGEISFFEKADLVERAIKTNASCLFVPENFEGQLHCALIKVKNPKLAFAKIAEKLYPPKFLTKNIHKTAVIVSEMKERRAYYVGEFVAIGKDCVIGENSQIYDGVKIGANVSIGRGTIIHPNCVIYDNVTIGNSCIIHGGAIIGADGFGFVRDGANGFVKFPQIGTVTIEDSVEIGANTCIDRGALGETRIGEGTKIDNLVQIAHNVQIGKRVVIAAQTGISGSTVIEDDCVIGGQVGIGDHATVKSGAVIGSQAGVLPNKIVRAGVWWGTPVQPLDQYKRQNAHVKGLARLKEDLREIKRRISELMSKIDD